MGNGKASIATSIMQSSYLLHSLPLPGFTVVDFTDPTKKWLPNLQLPYFPVAQFTVAHFTVAQFTANPQYICITHHRQIKFGAVYSGV